MTVTDRLTDEIARQMYEWHHLLGQPQVRMRLALLGDAELAIEYVDPKAVSDAESYLVIVTSTESIVGIVRDGALDAEPHRLPPARTACTLFRAAKA